MAKPYDNPEAFKQALMMRLKNAAASRALSVQDKNWHRYVARSRWRVSLNTCAINGLSIVKWRCTRL